MYRVKDFNMDTVKEFTSFKELKNYFRNVKANSYTEFRNEIKKLYGNDIQVNKY